MDDYKRKVALGFSLSGILFAIAGAGFYLSNDWKPILNDAVAYFSGAKESTNTKEDNASTETKDDGNTSKNDETNNEEPTTDVETPTTDASDGMLTATCIISETTKEYSNHMSLDFMYKDNKLEKVKYSVDYKAYTSESKEFLAFLIESVTPLNEKLKNIEGFEIQMNSTAEALQFYSTQDLKIAPSTLLTSKLSEGESYDLNYVYGQTLESAKIQAEEEGYSCNN